MDFESFPGLSTQEINAIGLSFMETLGSLLGYDPALYTDSYNAAYLWSSDFSSYPLWVADYDVNQPESTPMGFLGRFPVLGQGTGTGSKRRCGHGFL